MGLYFTNWRVKLAQVNMTVIVYFIKIKKLWNELNCLSPLLVCTCCASKVICDIENGDRLNQFLMGLNDSYDHVRNQVVIMEPLPCLNRSYSMVLSVEKQREALNVSPTEFNIAIMNAKVAKEGFTRTQLKKK